MQFNLRFTRIYVLLLSASALLATGCGKVSSPFFQKQAAIPDAQWRYDFQPEFQVDITDSTARYRVFLIFRHEEAFPYANLWVRLYSKYPGKVKFDEGRRVSCVLANAEGVWQARGLGGIWEHKILLKEGRDYDTLNKAGTYQFRIEQIMRDNPLPSALNVGLCIERIDGE